MLTVEGNKHRGHFIGDIYKYEVEGSPSLKGYDAFDYRGTGAIQTKDTNGMVLFHFRTPTFLKYRTKGEHLDLASAVINWRQELIELGAKEYRIVDYSEIVDLALESLLRRIELSFKSPIPSVETAVLSEHDLLSRGLIAETLSP